MERTSNMSDDFEQQEWVKFGIATTLSKQYSADQRVFLERLAIMLETGMPQETEVIRKGAIFSKKIVSKVIVHFGENRLMIEDEGRGPLKASRARIVRGIALKTESVSVDDWVSELSETIDERSKTNRAAREALSRFAE